MNNNNEIILKLLSMLDKFSRDVENGSIDFSGFREELDILRNYMQSTLNLKPYVAPATIGIGTGEWCKACGAWKQYGVADNHHCTGYKVTC